MLRDYSAEILAQFSCVGSELQYNVCDTVELVFFVFVCFFKVKS